MRLPIRIVQVCSSFVQRNSLSLTRKSKPEMSGQEGVLIMKLRRSLQCAAIALGCLVAPQIPGYAQAITIFDAPGSTGTFPLSINPAGEITGYYRDLQGYPHGFVRDASGTITSFDVPGSIGTAAISINPAGEITGVYYTSAPYPLDRAPHGFVRDASGTFSTFDVPGAPETYPTSINPAGEITGWYLTSGTAHQGFVRHARGTITSFDVPGAYSTVPASINPAGEITGVYWVAKDGGSFRQGFVRDARGTITSFNVLGASTTPTSINSAGEITGFYGGFSSGQGFVRDARGTITSFDPPGSREANPLSIKPAGEITGYYLDSAYGRHGFVRDARGTITSFDLPGVALPTSINDAGAITGYYFGSDAIHGFVRDAPADTIPPGTTPTTSPGPNANGWNNTNVTVTLNATDNPGGSGVKQIQFSLSGAQSGGGVVNANTASVVISGEGTTTLTYSAQDNAGNAEPQKTLIIQIDKTPPGAGAVASPKPNGNSWNNTNVTVTFSGTDAVSGIDFCTGAITLLGEGAGQSASGTCTDKAGNTSAPAAATINIDRTPPVISGMPAAGCSLWPPNHKLVQVAVVSAADPLSGVAPGSFEVMGTSNEPDADRAPQVVITRSNAGDFVVQLEAGGGTGRVYTLTATASDLAGNTVSTTAICTVAHDQRK